MGIRPERIASEMREIISVIISEELKDPRIGFITVTRVEVTPDIRNAKVYFSSLGGKEEKEDAAEGLNSASGFIRKTLGERMRFKFVPELLFRLDESAEYSIHLNEIFDKIHKEKEKKDEPS
ncbi:MAG: 30S ribosome-binding factor RbfA [Candidatus Omnitrophica bacterium]|nr:30S ribosome-binding factor RbfA [Candidatus Omnitrophota bacterium]MDD5310305.1 30S ribosome-binding factor RbfA [Candidatus Omnitrophota bacterium]MDD5545850.1 30S ribosome-binding factor RbfA [Candidatus Omnitrophota bacterium]